MDKISTTALTDTANRRIDRKRRVTYGKARQWRAMATTTRGNIKLKVVPVYLVGRLGGGAQSPWTVPTRSMMLQLGVSKFLAQQFALLKSGVKFLVPVHTSCDCLRRHPSGSWLLRYSPRWLAFTGVTT